MTPQATFLWLFNTCCDVVGQMAFKKAAVGAGDLEGRARWLKMLKDCFLWAGISAYVAEVASWIALLSLIPLSVAVMIGSVNIFAVMLCGRVLFKETLSPRRLVAILLISTGVGLVGWA